MKAFSLSNDCYTRPAIIPSVVIVIIHFKALWNRRSLFNNQRHSSSVPLPLLHLQSFLPREAKTFFYLFHRAILSTTSRSDKRSNVDLRTCEGEQERWWTLWWRARSQWAGDQSRKNILDPGDRHWPQRRHLRERCSANNGRFLKWSYWGDFRVTLDECWTVV